MFARDRRFAVMFLVVVAAGACESSAPEEAQAVGPGAPGGGAVGTPANGGGGRSSDGGATGAGGSDAGGRAGAAGNGQDHAGAGGEPSGGAGDGGSAGAGGRDGAAGSPGEATSPFAYVSTLAGDVLLCSLDPVSGAPSLLPSSPHEVEGFLHGVFVDPKGKFLFALAEPPRIETYRLAPDGTLPAQPSSSAAIDDDDALMTMALDPRGRFAYVGAPFGRKIYVFEIDSDTGELTLVGNPLSVGVAPGYRSPAYVAAEPTGNFVYVSQLFDPAAPVSDNGIRGYRVNQTTGALTELEDSPFGGNSVTGGAMVFSPDGKFLFSSGGGLNVFAIDAATGDLTLVEGSPFTQDVGSDPWATNLAIDSQGLYVYVSRFLVTQHVSGFSIDPTSGALEAVPGSPITSSTPYSIAIEPGGRFLYVGNDTGQVSVFGLDRSDGALTEIDGSPFPFGGLEPEFAFAPLP